MINKSKCLKISLVALLLSSTFTDGMQVMASTIRNSEEIPADVQTDPNTQDNVEQNQEPMFIEDSTEVEENQSTDSNEVDETQTSEEPKQEFILVNETRDIVNAIRYNGYLLDLLGYATSQNIC